MAPGEPGEILLRGGSIMSHYLDDPEATAARPSRPTAGCAPATSAWSTTPAACASSVGSKDMFIVGGFNAYPAEIENALLRHPDISQAAVIGIPDERLGEVGMAFVVLRPGAATTGADIIGLEPRPDGQLQGTPPVVELVDELPLNATGKVMKETLRERAAHGRPESAS